MIPLSHSITHQHILPLSDTHTHSHSHQNLSIKKFIDECQKDWVTFLHVSNIIIYSSEPFYLTNYTLSLSHPLIPSFSLSLHFFYFSLLLSSSLTLFLPFLPEGLLFVQFQLFLSTKVFWKKNFENYKYNILIAIFMTQRHVLTF